MAIREPLRHRKSRQVICEPAILQKIPLLAAKIPHPRQRNRAGISPANKNASALPLWLWFGAQRSYSGSVSNRLSRLPAGEGGKDPVSLKSPTSSPPVSAFLSQAVSPPEKIWAHRNGHFAPKALSIGNRPKKGRLSRCCSSIVECQGWAVHVFARR